MAQRRSVALPKVRAWRDPASDRTIRVELEGFGKQATEGAPNVVANEFVAFRIGSLMGLPVVPGAPMLVPPSRDVAWVSLALEGAVDRTPPSARPERIAAEYPEEAAGTVVFDLLIANHDRHRRNLACRSAGRKHSRLGLFDHDYALWGNSAGGPREHLEYVGRNFMLQGTSMTGGRLNRHCLLDHVDDHQKLMAWCDRAAELVSDAVIARICGEAAELPGPGPDADDARALQQLLRLRRASLRDLVNQNIDEFPSVDTNGRLLT